MLDFSAFVSFGTDGAPIFGNTFSAGLTIRFESRSHPGEIHEFPVDPGGHVRPDWDWRNDDDYYWSAYDRDGHFHNGGAFRPNDHCFDHGCDRVVNQTFINVYVLVNNQYVPAQAVDCHDGRWFVANTVYVTAVPQQTAYNNRTVIVPQGPTPYQYDRVAGKPTAVTPDIFDTGVGDGPGDIPVWAFPATGLLIIVAAGAYTLDRRRKAAQANGAR